MPEGEDLEVWNCRMSSLKAAGWMKTTLPQFNMVHLKMAPWKFGDVFWKPSFLGSMLNLREVPSYYIPHAPWDW